MRIGNINISDLKRGSTNINKVYRGTTLIWERIMANINITDPTTTDNTVHLYFVMSTLLNEAITLNWSYTTPTGTTNQTAVFQPMSGSVEVSFTIPKGNASYNGVVNIDSISPSTVIEGEPNSYAYTIPAIANQCPEYGTFSHGECDVDGWAIQWYHDGNCGYYSEQNGMRCDDQIAPA
jgi:hypothetical protein